MPSSLVGLLILVILLAPSFAFVVVRERRFPARTHSAFRETAGVALVSFATVTTAMCAFAVLRARWLSVTPDVGRLIREPGAYSEQAYRQLFIWGVGLLAGACLAAGLLGHVLPRLRGVSFSSAWWVLFHDRPADEVYIGCELVDGSYVGGSLYSYSTEIDETADRELSLTPPITYRAPGEADADELDDIGALTVSARQIKFLTVSYIEDEEPPALTGDNHAQTS